MCKVRDFVVRTAFNLVYNMLTVYTVGSGCMHKWHQRASALIVTLTFLLRSRQL